MGQSPELFAKNENPKPQSRKQGGKGGNHLSASVNWICDIPPDTVRRPGAMPLDVLQRDIVIKCKGGTWTSETVESDERRVFMQQQQQIF